jgi:hypothetical protein
VADALTVLGGALVDILREGLVRVRPRARVLLERVRELAEPPEGVTLTSPDGSTYTGLALVESNRVVLLLASRQEPLVVTVAGERAPLITPPPRPPSRPFYQQRPLLDPDDPMWDREDPYESRYK